MFQKAKIKRFNEEVNDGVPPVGSYDPMMKKDGTSIKFDQSDRFKKPHAASSFGSTSIVRVRSKDSLPDEKGSSSCRRNSGNEMRLLTREKSDLSRTIESQVKEMEQLKTRIETLTKEKEDLEEVNIHLKTKTGTVTEKDEEIARLKVEIIKVRCELDEAIIKFNRSKDFQQGLVMTFANHSDCLAVDMDGLSTYVANRLSSTASVLNKLENSVKIAQRAIEKEKEINTCLELNLKSEIAVATAEKDALIRIIKQDLEESIRREDGLSSEIQKLTEQLAVAKEELTLKSVEIEMEEQIKELKSEVVQLQAKLNEEVSTKDLKIGELESEVEKLSVYLKDMDVLLNEEKDKSFKLELHLQSEVAAAAEKAELIQSIKQNCVEALNRENNLKSEVQKLSEELCIAGQQELTLKTVEQETNRQIQKLKDKVDQVQNKMNEEIEIKDVKIGELESEVEKLSASLEVLNCSLDKEKDKNSQLELNLKNEVAVTAEKVACIQTIKLDLEEMLGRENDLKSEVQKLSQQLLITEQQRLSLKDVEQEMNLQIQDLKSGEVKLKEKIAELSVKSDTAEEVAKKMRKDLTRKDEALLQFQDVIAKNHELLSVKGSLINEIEEYRKKVSVLIANNEDMVKSINSFTSDRSVLESHLMNLNSEINRYKVDLERRCDREINLVRQLEVNDDKLKLMRQDYNNVLKANRDLHQKLHDLDQELKSSKAKVEEYGKCNESLLQQVTSEYEMKLQGLRALLNSNQDELEKWKSLYEELQERIAPFKEQLDAYEIEKRLLESQNVEASSSLKKMGDQLATLLGHHNQRQRIHYVDKLKEDFFKVKEENKKLWSELLKLRKAHASAPSSARKFDPKRAFQHSKENVSTPLKDSNR
ncbi:hypothetical protein CHUAL_004022 [Chamberlinius hualienensis]